MTKEEIINELETLSTEVAELAHKLHQNPILPVAKSLRSRLAVKRARQSELMKALPVDELVRYLK